MNHFSQFKSSKRKSEYEEYCRECDKRWPLESDEYYIETKYGSTFVRESGIGEPLVLLPGTKCSSLVYDKIIKKLSKDFYRICC